MTSLELRQAEYRIVGDRLAGLGRAGVEPGDPEALKLQAREIEIVDTVRAMGLAPDVLLKPLPPRGRGVADEARGR
jgi:hypothetical protein